MTSRQTQTLLSYVLSKAGRIQVPSATDGCEAILLAMQSSMRTLAGVCQSSVLRPQAVPHWLKSGPPAERC